MCSICGSVDWVVVGAMLDVVVLVVARVDGDEKQADRCEMFEGHTDFLKKSMYDGRLARVCCVR